MGVDYGMKSIGIKPPVLAPYVPPPGIEGKCAILSSQTKLIFI